MKTNLRRIDGAPSRGGCDNPVEVCASPALAGLLPDYIVDLLEDSAAEEVEEHLLDCRQCREWYLKIIDTFGAARGARAGGGVAKGRGPSSGAKLLKLSDAKKRRP